MSSITKLITNYSGKLNLESQAKVLESVLEMLDKQPKPTTSNLDIPAVVIPRKKAVKVRKIKAKDRRANRSPVTVGTKEYSSIGKVLSAYNINPSTGYSRLKTLAKNNPGKSDSFLVGQLVDSFSKNKDNNVTKIKTKIKKKA